MMLAMQILQMQLTSLRQMVWCSMVVVLLVEDEITMDLGFCMVKLQRIWFEINEESTYVYGKVYDHRVTCQYNNFVKNSSKILFCKEEEKKKHPKSYFMIVVMNY